MTEIEVLTGALDEAGLIAVWLGTDRAQIVCKPGRFEHAKHALGLDDRASTIEECAKVAEAKAAEYLSPEYATGQPMSSFSERFACGQIADAIRSLTKAGKGE